MSPEKTPAAGAAHPVDWAFAARTAAALAPAGPRFTAREARREAEGLRTAAEASVPHVHRLTGLEAARDLRDGGVLVVDRPTWSASATQSFAAMLEPTFAHLRATRPQEYAATTSAVTTRATGLEMGGILVWMSARVLGQYDPFAALPGADGTPAAPAGGRLLLNAPTIAQVRTEINKEIETVTKVADPLKILASADTMKLLGVQRPVLQVPHVSPFPYVSLISFL